MDDLFRLMSNDNLVKLRDRLRLMIDSSNTCTIDLVVRYQSVIHALYECEKDKADPPPSSN